MKEPFFDDHINSAIRFQLAAEAFKIPPSTDYPLMVSIKPPSAPKSVRRPSREPYYTRSLSSRSASSSSSYAKLSDIFDYGYLDHIRSQEHENALVFDSDSDYEDVYAPEVQEDAKAIEKQEIIAENVRSFKKLSNCDDLESEEESGLEDYSVHMLTFNVNARAQYTRPPRRSSSVSSDYFDEPTPRDDLDPLKISSHPKFAAPSCKNTFPDTILPSPSVDLEEYAEKCATDFPKPEMRSNLPPATFRKLHVVDDYGVNCQSRDLRDDFEGSQPMFVI
ncbi:hypothetical protein OXX59_001888 [Metschnikowia pulcherrima]